MREGVGICKTVRHGVNEGWKKDCEELLWREAGRRGSKENRLAEMLKGA